MERKSIWLAIVFCLSIAEGFGMKVFAEQAVEAKLPQPGANEMRYLKEIEEATFRGFDQLIDPATQFPVDIASVSSGDVVRRPQDEYSSKTSPTNIGFGFLFLTLAKERGYLTASEAYERALLMMTTLEKLKTYKGFLYNWYYLNGRKGEVPRVSQDRFISSLDNGDMDISLMVTAGAFPDTELAERIDAYLRKKNYRFFYDKNPSGVSNGMISVGFDQAKRRYHAADYSVFNIEGRMTVLISILKDKLPDSAWEHMLRLVKTYRARDGSSVSVVAPWGGSLYETLFADEIVGGFRIAPNAFRANALRMIRIHRDYGMRISKSGIWGFSNGEVPAENKYEMAGVPEIAYNRFPGKFVTVYSSFLSLRYAPEAVIENLKKIEILNPKAFNPKYGFTDSIDPRTGKINFNILSLDKGMELLSIANFMSGLEGKKEVPDHLWSYFKQKGWDKKARSLLEGEEKHPSFRAISAEAGSQAPAVFEKAPPIDVMEARQELGTFNEPDRATASFHLMGSEEKGKQVVEVFYDVTMRYSFSGLYFKFDDLDISNHGTLSFQIRGDGEKAVAGTVKVELKSKGQYVAFDHVEVDGRWKKASINLPSGNKTIDEMAFVFENSSLGNHPKGKVDIRSLIFEK